MKLTICKLTPERLADWLDFFDRDAFTDNSGWCGCYCMCYHWTPELNRQQAWDCSADGAAFNREQAIRRIQAGQMQGYLAYTGDKVVGWCNANDKAAYSNINFDFAAKAPDNGEKIKSIVCFTISPPPTAAAASLLRC